MLPERMLTEKEFDRLTDIIPDLTAMQLWNIADTFDRRIVDREAKTEREPAGFRA